MTTTHDRMTATRYAIATPADTRFHKGWNQQGPLVAALAAAERRFVSLVSGQGIDMSTSSTRAVDPAVDGLFTEADRREYDARKPLSKSTLAPKPLTHFGANLTMSLLGSLNAAWQAIRVNHPEIPSAIIILGGADKPGILGHHCAGCWQHSTGTMPEIMVAGYGLRRGALDVFSTLLHEGAHALSGARGVKDTSRQGRYHNDWFKRSAETVGLECEPPTKMGWSQTHLTPETEVAYADAIAGIAKALSFYRVPTVPKKVKKAEGWVRAECGCGRIIRMSTTTLIEGGIECNLCHTGFSPDSELAEEIFGAFRPLTAAGAGA